MVDPFEAFKAPGGGGFGGSIPPHGRQQGHTRLVIGNAPDPGDVDVRGENTGAIRQAA